MSTVKKIASIAGIFLLGLARPAGAQIFEANVNADANSIGAYDFNGATANESLITGLSQPMGLALSGDELFVLNAGNGTQSIGAYTTGGDEVNSSIVSGLHGAQYLAVSGNLLFVTNLEAGSIGEYTASGETVNTSLVTGLNAHSSFATGIAATGNLLLVLNNGNPDVAGSGWVSAYHLGAAAGTIDLPSLTVASGLTNPTGIAVSGDDFFVLQGDGTIGEYTLSGQTVDAALVTGLKDPSALAISGNDLFIASRNLGTISEYTTSGEMVDPALVTGLTQGLSGLAVAPMLNPPLLSGIAASSFAVPEPNGWVLVSIGVGALAGAGRSLRPRTFAPTSSRR